MPIQIDKERLRQLVSEDAMRDMEASGRFHKLDPEETADLVARIIEANPEVIKQA
jgi:hypothetical protein